MNSGPPKVTCHICKKEVFKRATVAIGNGNRACREHPEAMAQAVSNRAADKLAKEKMEARQKKNKDRIDRLHEGFGLKCCVCAKIGKQTGEIAADVLLDKARILLRSPNTDDQKAFVEAVTLHKNDVELVIVKYEGRNKEIMDRIGLYELVSMGDLVGVVVVCRQCIIEHRELELPPSSVDFMKMVELGAIMKPLADAMFMEKAVKESTQNN